MSGEERHSILREQFIAKRGYWNDEWEFILAHDPDYFEAYLHLSSHAWEQGTLDPKTREFVYIATSATVTHLFERGIRQHMRNALALGATAEELMAVLALVSTVGIQTYYLGVSVLEDLRPDLLEAVQAGNAAASGEGRPCFPDVDSVVDKHVRLYGSVSDATRSAIATDPVFYDRFLNLAAVSLESPSILPTKVAHLILVSVYACATGLLASGVRQHMAAALAHGATAAELIEVCELITGMSVHTLSVGVPVLYEELLARK
jgi:alkylhydroperoxidase/carboxymuconolactone decarboxylase family protein YurZ